MIVKAVRSQGLIGVPLEIKDVQSIVVCDDYGNPLALHLQRGAGNEQFIFTKTADEEGFAESLATLGIGTRTKYEKVHVGAIAP